MTDADKIGDMFRDSVAYARSVTRGDWEAAELIALSHSHPYDIMVPLSWLVVAAVGRLADATDLTVDEVWSAMLQSIDNPKWNMDEDE